MPKRIFLPLLAAGSVVVVVWGLVRFTPVVPDQIAHSFTANLLRERGYRLEIGRVRGNPIGDLVLTDVTLYREHGGAGPAAVVRELHLYVHPWKLFRGKVEIGHLQLVAPWVRLGPEGIQRDLLRPTTGVARAVMPPLRIGRFEIESGVVELQPDSGAAVRVQVPRIRLALQSSDTGWQVDLDRLAARIPERGVELRSGSGTIRSEGDSIVLRDVRLETAQSKLDLEGMLRPGKRELRIAGNAAPFALADLDSIATLPVHGSITGPIRLELRDGTVEFAGTWSGTLPANLLWDRSPAYALQDVQVDLVRGPGLLEVRRASGRLAGNAFDLACNLKGSAVQGRADVTGLDLRSLRADLPPSAITGRVRFARASAHDTLRVDTALLQSRLAGWSFDGLAVSLGVLDGHVQVRRANLRSPGLEANVTGAASAEDVALEWDLEATDLAPGLATLGIKDMHGKMRARGSVAGPRRSPACTAAGDFEAFTFGSVSAGMGDFTLNIPTLERAPRVELDVHGNGLRLGGRKFESFSSSLAYADGELELERTRASTGDTLVAFAGSVRPETRDWLGEPRRAVQLRLLTALAQLGSQEIRVEDPASIWWSEKAVRVDSLRLVTRGASLRVDGDVDLAESRIDTRCEIQDFDLALLARLLRRHLDLGGTGTGWLELHGSLEHTQVDARLGLDAGHWNTLPFDSLRVDLQSDAFGTALQMLRLHTPNGSVQMQGRVAYLPSLRRWFAEEHGSRAPEELSKALVEGTLRLDDVHAEQVWAAARPVSRPPDWTARVTARFNLEGTVGAPRVGAVGVVHNVRAAKTVQIDSLAFTARYAEGDLEVQRFGVGAAGGLVQAAGHVPLDLNLARGVHLRRDDAVAARVQLPKGSSFAVVTHFISLFVPPPAGLPLGTIEANLDVSGTAGTPKLRGDFRVEGASFMLKDMDEVYRDVHAVGMFEGDKLRLTELRGKSGPEGWAQGKGRGDGPPGEVYIKGLRVTGYQFGVDVSKIPVFSIPEMAALVSGHLDIRGVDVGLPQPVPDISGSLQILEATITKDFEPDSQAADLIESTDRPEWLADLNLQANGRVWVRNSNADAELAGNVQLVRNIGAGMDFKGSATVRRGYYGVYLDRFEITRGDLDFSRYAGFEPSLDIEGRRGRPGQRIYVHLTGRPSEPHLAFSSDQGGTSEELQQELLTAIHNDPGAAASSAISQLLANFEYLDSISIDPASTTGSTPTSNEKGTTTSLLQPYNVSAGLALTDRVFMTYTYGFNRSDLNQRVALELDVLRGVLLSSAWEQRSVPSRQETTDSAQNAFQLDLKFRYER